MTVSWYLAPLYFHRCSVTEQPQAPLAWLSSPINPSYLRHVYMQCLHAMSINLRHCLFYFDSAYSAVSIHSALPLPPIPLSTLPSHCLILPFSTSLRLRLWTLSDVYAGCQLNAMIVYLCGCTSIAHFAAISIERVMTVSNPIWSMARRGRTLPYLYVMIAFCWLYGLVWSVMPLVGRSGLHASWFPLSIPEHLFNLAHIQC